MCENKPNSNPIQSQYKPNTNPIPEMPKMNENLFATKVYENITTFRLEQNKPNTNPTCRGVASGEAGSNPISNVLPYCSAQAGKFRRNDKNVGWQAKCI